MNFLKNIIIPCNLLPDFITTDLTLVPYSKSSICYRVDLSKSEILGFHFNLQVPNMYIHNEHNHGFKFFGDQFYHCIENLRKQRDEHQKTRDITKYEIEQLELLGELLIDFIIDAYKPSKPSFSLGTYNEPF